jgi:hypothetical protein
LGFFIPENRVNRLIGELKFGKVITIPISCYMNPLILAFSLWRRENMRTYWNWHKRIKSTTTWLKVVYNPSDIIENKINTYFM